ncbi:MAG: hypothetical protein OEY22_09460 [Candidatus Bathyarchaeota archaeon]|nr:hypothetical protein [Candidatus Bathyarchaeota archaeon]MDH5788868.1 hypothetical protein [Candidatus Bathyarchaeota archaeon]
MPIPQALVTRYFQLLVSRQFSEAERELERLKQKMQKTEWNRGYFRALFGMLLARRSKNNDAGSFFSKLDFGDKAALHDYRREFLDHTKNGLHGDFDRGFFSAWTDCIRVLSRMQIANSPNANSATSKNGKVETLKNDKSQATMGNFLKGKED